MEGWRRGSSDVVGLADQPTSRASGPLSSRAEMGVWGRALAAPEKRQQRAFAMHCWSSGSYSAL